MRSLTILWLILALALPLAALAEPAGVIVVRHAEKADDGTRNPGLTAAGRTRAEALAIALQHANVTGMIASQYQRTRQTLATLAQRRGLEITVVPAESGGIDSHIDAIATMVRESDTAGLLVIAGHSNTVPLIVEALSGNRIAPIGEEVYDRLFILLPDESGMDVIETRYGKPSETPSG